MLPTGLGKLLCNPTLSLILTKSSSVLSTRVFLHRHKFTVYCTQSSGWLSHFKYLSHVLTLEEWLYRPKKIDVWHQTLSWSLCRGCGVGTRLGIPYANKLINVIMIKGQHVYNTYIITPSLHYKKIPVNILNNNQQVTTKSTLNTVTYRWTMLLVVLTSWVSISIVFALVDGSLNGFPSNWVRRKITKNCWVTWQDGMKVHVCTCK